MHPKARILADAGPIIIGENNLIEEQSLIINKYVDHTCSIYLILAINVSYLLLSVCLAIEVYDLNIFHTIG